MCLLSLGLASAAAAKPPAPGAPGAIHTWAPADKHGFGSAEQLAQQGVVHAAAGLAERDLLPGPQHARRSAACSSRSPTASGSSHRETVDDDPRHIEPLAPGVTRASSRCRRSLGFRQVTRGTGWKLTKTWITDPVAGDRARARALRVADRQDAAALRARRSGAGQRRQRRPRPPRARGSCSRSTTSRRAPSPPSRACGETSSGYRGTRERSVDATCRTTSACAATTRPSPATSCRARGRALDGVRKRPTMTLAIGFGAQRRRRGGDRGRRRSRAASGARAAASTRAGCAYLRSLKAPPRSVARDARLRRLYEQSVLVLAASEDKTYRGASIAAPSMAWIWGTMTLEPERRFSGPYHLVWPRDLYHVATAQKAAGDDAAADRLLDYLWRVQKPAGDWWQNTFVDGTREVDDRAARPGVAPDRARLVAGPDERRRTGRTSSAPPTTSSTTRTARAATRSAGRTRTATRPNTIATEIAGLICAADIARKNGEPAKAAEYEALADSWQRSVEGWTATTNGPYSPKPYYLRVTKDGMPNNGTHLQPRRQLRPARSTSARSSTTRSSAWSCSASRSGTTRRCSTRSTVGDGNATTPYPLKVNTPSGPIWHRFTYDGYGEQAERRRLGPVLRQPGAPDARPPVAAAHRRARRVRADRRAQRRPAPADDRQHRQRRADAARAGVGRPAAARASAPARARARRRRWRGRTASSSGWRGRSTPGEPIERPVDRRLPLPAGAVPPLS